jgi:hypothetical protein
MRLELFDLVDKSTRMLQMKQHIFQYVEKTVVDQFKKMLGSQDVDSIAFTSRIKSSKSLKEKMIRNKYYLQCSTPEDVFNLLSAILAIHKIPLSLRVLIGHNLYFHYMGTAPSSQEKQRPELTPVAVFYSVQLFLVDLL